MHMTKEADYAVRIVHSIAKKGKRTDARTLSDELGVPLRFSLKILGKLTASGMLRSFKGQGGGYELARDAADITLCDVIETVDGPYALNRCLKAGHDCVHMDDDCLFRNIYADISDLITEKLRGITFASLVEQSRR